MCVYIPRYLAGFVYCAFSLSSLMKIKLVADCHRQRISKLFSTSGSGFVLQVEEHRYAKCALHSHPRRKALKSQSLKQHPSITAGIKKNKCGGCFPPKGAIWVCMCAMKRHRLKKNKGAQYKVSSVVLDERYSVNGPCYAIPEVCQVGRASFSKITVFHFVQVGHTHSCIYTQLNTNCNILLL